MIADEPPTWPSGTVEALLDTEHVTTPTRAALRARLERPSTPPACLSPRQYATLRAVGARLIPQPDADRQVDLAGSIDARLARGEGDGWRYDALPPDPEAYRRGLDGLDRAASILRRAAFAELDAGGQDWLLGLCQTGELAASLGDMPCGRWFEELLAEATEVYYAHPWAQEAIGYVGMADTPGWSAVGLDRLELREPRAVPAREGERRAQV